MTARPDDSPALTQNHCSFLIRQQALSPGQLASFLVKFTRQNAYTGHFPASTQKHCSLLTAHYSLLTAHYSLLIRPPARMDDSTVPKSTSLLPGGLITLLALIALSDKKSFLIALIRYE
jgi:hypothetical protein